MILRGLGGKENISDVDCCATRLRITVENSEIVNDSMLKESGASGVIRKGNGIQIIYGPQVSVVKSNFDDFLESDDSDMTDELLGEMLEPSTEKEKTEEKHSKKTILSAHLNGSITALEDVEDEAFSEKVLGDGIAIEPAEGKLYSPCDGKVDMVFDTKHAINLISDDGCEILLHIGIDTVKLMGKHFKAHVTDGQRIRKGDLLITFNINEIRRAGFKTTTPMIVCNSDEYEKFIILSTGTVSAGDDILELE